MCFTGCDGNNALDVSDIRGERQGKGALMKDMQEVIDEMHRPCMYLKVMLYSIGVKNENRPVPFL